MPANLTPDYRAAEARFRAAETDEDKLRALEDMLATIPKHKGTEKLQADIKRRIAKMRDKHQQSRKGKHYDEFRIEKQGAGQIALYGYPNSGKSSILAKLTSAEPEIADYPFTTMKPIPGMMEYEDILIQIIDLPPIATEHIERGIFSILRLMDTIAVVLDSSDCMILEHIEGLKEEAYKSRILLV